MSAATEPEDGKVPGTPAEEAPTDRQAGGCGTLISGVLGLLLLWWIVDPFGD